MRQPNLQEQEKNNGRPENQTVGTLLLDERLGLHNRRRSASIQVLVDPRFYCTALVAEVILDFDYLVESKAGLAFCTSRGVMVSIFERRRDRVWLHAGGSSTLRIPLGYRMLQCCAHEFSENSTG